MLPGGLVQLRYQAAAPDDGVATVLERARERVRRDGSRLSTSTILAELDEDRA